MFAIREIFGRSGLTAREVEILNGMAADAWVTEGGHRDARREAARARIKVSLGGFHGGRDKR